MIGPTGLISFPLAGQVRAAGQTPERLEKLLKARLRDKYTTDFDVWLPQAKTEDDQAAVLCYWRGAATGPLCHQDQDHGAAGDRARRWTWAIAANRRIQIRREINGLEPLIVFDYRAFEAGTNF